MDSIELFVDFVEKKTGDQLEFLEKDMEKQIEDSYVINNTNIFAFYKELEYFRHMYMRDIPVYIVSDQVVEGLLKVNVEILNKKIEKYLKDDSSLYSTDILENTYCTLKYIKPFHDFILEEIKMFNTVLYFQIDNFSPKKDKSPLTHKKIGTLRILSNEHYKSLLKNLSNVAIDQSAKIYATTFPMLEYARDIFFTEKSSSIAKKKAIIQRFGGLI